MIQIVISSLCFCGGLILGISAASSFYEKVYVQYWESKMAVFTKKQAVHFLVKDAPIDLGSIEAWVHQHPEYEPLLMDYFKCRKYQLPHAIYGFKKSQK